ncbi:MAG: hypothetical protein H0V45_13890 [Actinobacteria bacterium]|nr:hypothetical protein [Actinomycetota bacterium]
MGTRFALLLAALAFVGFGAEPCLAASAYFETPSRNIACAWLSGFGGSLRCEIASLLRPLPPRPVSCDVDWGYGISMGRTGRARVLCAGDTVRRTGPVRILAYGSTWRAGGFRCVSARIGLRCTNSSEHGFFLSRERWRVF